MLSENAIKYTVQHLIDVAFPPTDRPRFEVSLASRCVSVFVLGIRIDIPLLSEAQFQDFLQGKARPEYLYNLTKTYQIPVFKPLEDATGELRFTEQESLLTIPFDIVSPSFALLSRIEELSSADFDTHGRLKHESSICRKYNITDIPLVDEYAVLLRSWLARFRPCIGDFVPATARFVPTHDIDILVRFTSKMQALRSILGRDLLIERDFNTVRRSFKEYISWCVNSYNDPYISSIFALLDTDMVHNCTPIFFFKAQLDREYDSTYDISSVLTTNIIKELVKKGARVGLHGSYESASDENLLAKEKSRLQDVLQEDVPLVRQHYLRAQFSKQSNSLRVWESAGVSHDYSVGFAERPGFKCGTCHTFRIYDVINDHPSTVVEHPLILMDGSLFDYMKIPPDEAYSLANKLYRRCAGVGGDFVVLWHNHTTTRKYLEYYEKVFLKLLDS